MTFNANPEGFRAVYVINASGGSPQRISPNHTDSANASWSKDGRWILFDSTTTKPRIYKVPAEGGPAVLVTNKGGWAPRESTDGRFIYSTGESADGHTLLRTAVQDGATQQVLDSIADPGWSYQLVEDGVYFIPNPDPKSGYSIQFLNTTTGIIERIASLGKAVAGDPAVSPDRR